MVVQAANIRELREVALQSPEDERIGAFTGGFLGVDDRSRMALDILLRAVAGSEAASQNTAQGGGAFFLNGVFGSGKSHLLGVLALLTEHAGHRAFRESHPALAPLLGRLLGRKYLGVHFALDDYAPAQWSLEEVAWREIGLEWERRNLGQPPVAAPDLSRREQWAELGEHLRSVGLEGLLLCVDELSLFLSARPHAGLQSDAAFLQFVGQRARLAGEWPLCVACALQKTVDDIGGIETYSLHQIRDRYTTLQLSLAHVPTLIERRLLRIEDVDARDKVARDTWEQILEALPRFEGDADEWRRLMPFHPPAVALLEAIVSRFLSRTRSAALFCAQSLENKADSPATTRIGLSELFDYLWPEIEEHLELRPLAEVRRSWEADIIEIAGQASDVPLLRRLMHGLLLFKVAGFAPDVAQITHALALDAGLREGNYAFVQVLLERIRARGGHLAVERRAPGEDGGDRWTIDAGLKTAEVARRALRGLIEQLPPGDERLSRHAIECCRSSLLPLHHAREVRSQAITWKNAPRSVAWRLWSGEDAEIEWAANRVAALAQPGQADDWLLLVAPPFGRLEPAREALDALSASLGRGARSKAERWRERVALWMPRQPLDEEWQRAREAAAGALLRQDPQMLDNRRGRAILHHVAQEQEPREALLERVCVRLLREGEIIAGDGAAIEAGDLALGEGWAQHVEGAAQWALEGVFARFESVAPRARVLTPSVGDQLCLEALRRPPEAPFFAPSLERAVRAIAEPLGGAREREGRWHIAAGRPDLVQAMEAALDELSRAPSASQATEQVAEQVLAGENTSAQAHMEEAEGAAPEDERGAASTSSTAGGASVSVLEALFAKNEWGLRPEQFQLALCLLLRDGRWQALDSRFAPLSASRIGMPLRRSVHAVRRGEKIERATWQRLSDVAQVLAPLDSSADLSALATPSGGGFEAQEKARAALLAWLEGARLDCEGLRARAHQLARQLGHSAAQWSAFNEAMSRAETILTLDASRPAAPLLADFVRLATDDWLQSWRHAREWRQSIEARGSSLMQAHAFLTSPDLAAPPEMALERQALLERLARGEEVAREEGLVQACESWRDAFSARYLEWHGLQNAPARWLSVERVLASDDLRVLGRLEGLSMAAFEGARSARSVLEEERARRCSHDGSGGAWSACCPACHLRWGQRLELRPLEGMLRPASEDVERLKSLRDDAGVRERLERAHGAQARDWIAWDGESASLALLTSPQHLNALDEALRPRRVFERRLEELPQVLASCRTRAECERAFGAWLDGGAALRGDDEIDWA